MEDGWGGNTCRICGAVKGGPHMYTLYVGVDVSKDSFSARGLDNKGDTCFSLTADMNYKGFLDLLSALSSHSSSLASVIVGMASTLL